MKHLLAPLAFAAALSGCAVVSPYEQPYGPYPPNAAYVYPYTDMYGQVVPGPAYYPPVYVWPPVRLSFRLQFWSGHGKHHGHHHGFGKHRFGGWHGHGKR